MGQHYKVVMNVHCHKYGDMTLDCLLVVVLTTSKVISRWVPLLRVHTHGAFIVIPHWETRPFAP